MEDDLKGMTAGQLLHHMMDSFQSPEEKGYQLLDHAYKHLTPLPPLPKGKLCALPGCGRKVGLPPWTLLGKPEEYCSRACTDLVFQAGKKGRTGMRVPATDFGDLLTRLKCDVCDSPVLINWKSRDGKDCCSRECQKKAEEDSMTDTETTDTTTTDPKPITAGVAAPAKKSSKKAAKAIPPIKVKKPAKKAATPGKFADEDVIHVISKDHGYRDGSKRMLVHGLIKDGMKVGKFKAVLAAREDLKGYTVPEALERAVRAKLIKISK